ncbi:jg25163 [Pararge aegeria aegeria]|uniref:Jg25163 protein n=1 Tax=Pararge aegeria aegeria TaxID=348720 RepID=A0A8S4RX43_9NEOP|nr:jg25163 [Pararge aegeria aegeria]
MNYIRITFKDLATVTPPHSKMHSQVLVLFSLFCAGWSRDITLGNTEGRKIFDEVRQANPALWRQFENVTVIAPENELISNVVITDMRPEKDGDVQIVDGGDRKKSVTIELKSPTVLRGYEFHIEVYSVPDTVATDAEEQLNNDMPTIQSNESTVLPDSASIDDTHNDEPVQGNGTTEMPDEDDKEGPIAVKSDINTDSNRPPRETEENISLSEIPEDYTTTISYKTSSSSESDESITMEQEETTELPETPGISTAGVVNPDSIRPARETAFGSSVIASAPPVTNSAEGGEATTEESAASGTPETEATESAVIDVTTTEAEVTTASDEYSTFTPIAYDNSKNIPDYPSLNILDYIKNRETLRPIRHTEDESETEDESPQPSVQPDENTYETTSLAGETSSINPEDETVDLVPPEVDASYNSDFDSSETTEHTVEDSAMNTAPRAGRGINFDSEFPEEITTTSMNTEEESTPTPTFYYTTPTFYEDHTTELLDDQLRNTRGARKEYGDENDINISEEIPQGTSLPNEESIPSEAVEVKQPNRNIIIVNLDELIARDENSKFIYALPIVLVINGENKYPIIKIIAEDASNESDNMDSNVLYPTQPSDESLEPNDPTNPSNESLEPNEYDYKSMDSVRIKKGDYMPSGDYEQSQ